MAWAWVQAQGAAARSWVWLRLTLPRFGLPVNTPSLSKLRYCVVNRRRRVERQGNQAGTKDQELH